MSQLSNNYSEILAGLKERIRLARLKAVLTANSQLLKVYWEIGSTILEQQEMEGWGAKIIQRLAIDLKVEFPDFKGLSVRNLNYMRAFAEAYPQFSIVQQSVAQLGEKADSGILAIMQHGVAQLPWGHHTVILTKLKSWQERVFYIQKCVENNWSRDILAAQIESKLIARTGTSLNNFVSTLPEEYSDLANATFKNPYLFDFLGMGEKMLERDLERALINHLKKFMLELGKGFAYVGNQYNLNVEGDDFFLDLLFYNTHLHCYVVFELKIGAFKPEFAGKLNFYINTIDEKIKGEKDNPTIGILLCKTPNETVVKYSLQNMQSPIGVSDYQLADALPKQLRGEIPTIEELETEIDESYEELKSPTQKKLETLKEKLGKIKGNEVRVTVTTPILFDIIDKSLVPLYETLISRMDDLNEFFVSNSCFWDIKEGNVKNLSEVAENWKSEEFLKSRYDLNFQYAFHGFKKAGTDAFNIHWQLNFKIDTYWYGFVLLNYTNNQPMLKKLYDEQLTKEDIQFLADTICNYIIEDIDRRVENLNEERK